MLASLNHPNIGAIYGFEESNGIQALVLELVDGPSYRGSSHRRNDSAGEKRLALPSKWPTPSKRHTRRGSFIAT